MHELPALIRAEILANGQIRFDRFMDLALYHPELGYYRRPREKPRTGRKGDFFTSVSVGPLFGRLLARQFLEMWERMEKPDRFWIVEQGGEDAQLACDILTWCHIEAPAFFAAIQYALIESDPGAQILQKEKLQTEGLSATWFRDVSDWANCETTGVFFSNELADAFPTRVVTLKDKRWHERHVTLGTDAKFIWIDQKIDDPELQKAIGDLALPEVEGYTTEINLCARQWMESTGRALRKGYVLTIDYGFPASLYYASFRLNGTLTAYRQHQRLDDVLDKPGSCDITAHVDFTALARAGEKAGLATFGFLDQQHFLMGIAETELSGAHDLKAGIAENSRAWNTLTHPGYLGARFQVLLQGKDAPTELAGSRFARSGGLD